MMNDILNIVTRYEICNNNINFVPARVTNILNNDSTCYSQLWKLELL